MLLVSFILTQQEIYGIKCRLVHTIANLKSFWDELINYRPLPTCSCGGLKGVADFQQQEYVMKFLVGLNETFGHIRGQILLSDPLPPINKLFSLILQEKRQREVASMAKPNFEAAAFITQTDPTANAFASQHHPAAAYCPGTRSLANQTFRKDRPICSHCGFTGHTIYKCYKLHGYPPGYKPNRSKIFTSTANQVSVSSDNDSETPSHYTSQEQYQHLLTLLSSNSSVPNDSNDS